MRVAIASALLTLTACSQKPPSAALVDPVADVVNATPAGTVGAYVFHDKIVIRNATDTGVSSCTFLVDEAFSADVGAVAGGQTVTVMRTKFRPYVESEEFYRRGSSRKSMTCLASTGWVKVEFSSGPEQRVVVPGRR